MRFCGTLNTQGEAEAARGGGRVSKSAKGSEQGSRGKYIDGIMGG